MTPNLIGNEDSYDYQSLSQQYESQDAYDVGEIIAN